MTLTHSDVYALGYPYVLPLIPRQKKPGLPNGGGEWHGITGWAQNRYEDADRRRWTAIGAGVGFMPGHEVLVFDADTKDPVLAELIREAIEALAPNCPLRIGEAPKAAYFVRVEKGTKAKDLAFDGGHLEFRGGFTNMVLEGVHPDTQQPYTWPRPLTAFANLPFVSAAALDGLLADLKAVLPNASDTRVKNDSVEASLVDQDKLRGDPALVAAAMKAMPNPATLGYKAFVDRVYALKGALPDDLGLAEDLFGEWCDKWEGGVSKPEDQAKAWRSVKPPVKMGASWIYEQTDAMTGSSFKTKAAFDVLPDEPSEALPGIKWVDPSEWEGAAPRPREWEVVHWIPKGEVTLIYGDGGIGKTLIVHQYATCAAAGLNWLDQETRKARVMCFFCEDSEDELMRRQIDINRSLGVTMGALSEGLRIASRKYMDNLLALWDRNTGAMKRQSVWETLLRDALAFKADVLVIDTIADTYGGSEIDRGQVNAFVKSCLGRLAQEIGGSVIALGHPSMAGKASGSGTSGSTAWSNAARSRLFLRYPKGVDAGNIREMEGMKSNYGPKGALLKLRWNAGAFDVLASNMPAAEKSGPKAFQNLDGPEPVAPVASASVLSGYTTAATFGLSGKSIEGMAIDAVLAALRACSGVALNMKVNSPSYAPKVLLAREADLLAGLDRNDVEKAVRRLDKEGALVVVEVGRTATRHPVTGYAVNDNLGADKMSKLDIFG